MAELYLVWSFEHDGWWRAGGWGYTRELAEAGRYAVEDAQWIVARANLVTVNEQAVPLEDGPTFTPPPSFACPWCRRRSFNLHDVREQYCGACHRFVED